VGRRIRQHGAGTTLVTFRNHDAEVRCNLSGRPEQPLRN
jgi:hypothetical protein